MWIKLPFKTGNASLRLQPFPRRKLEYCDFIQLEWSDLWLQQNHHINLIQTPPPPPPPPVGLKMHCNSYRHEFLHLSKCKNIQNTANRDSYNRCLANESQIGLNFSVPQTCRAFSLATPPVVSEPATLCLPSPLLDSGNKTTTNNKWVTMTDSRLMHHLSITTQVCWKSLSEGTALFQTSDSFCNLIILLSSWFEYKRSFVFEQEVVFS